MKELSCFAADLDRANVFSQVKQSVSVILKIEANKDKIALVGERRVQVLNVALDVLVGCLRLIEARMERQPHVFWDAVMAWMISLLRAALTCKIDMELLLGKASMLYVDQAETDDIGIKLLWCINDSLFQAKEGLRGHFSTLFRLSLITHCFKTLRTSSSVCAIQARQVEYPCRDMIALVIPRLVNAQCVYPKCNELFIQEYFRLVQQVVYKSAEDIETQRLMFALDDLARTISEGVKVAWILDTIHKSPEPLTLGRTLLPSQCETSTTPENPWKMSKYTVELVLEFLLQHEDALGAQGGKLGCVVLHNLGNWDQLSLHSHTSCMQQLYFSVLRTITPQVTRMMQRMAKSDEESGIKNEKYFEAMLDLGVMCMQRSLQPSNASLSDAATPYLMRQGYQSKAIGYDEKTANLITGFTLLLFRCLASTLKQENSSPRIVESLRSAVQACFRTIGRRDVHWGAIWASSLRVFGQDWAEKLSDFEVSASILRCCVDTCTQVDYHSDKSLETIVGVVSALHQLEKNGAATIQGQIARSKQYHIDVVSSGEYTISLFASRCAALIELYLNKTRDIYDHVHIESIEYISERLCTFIEVLTMRACASRVVYKLPIEVLLGWLPTIALTLGDVHETRARGGSRAFLEIVKCVTMRGNMTHDMTQTKTKNATAERSEAMDMILLRILETWHALFATGKLPGWAMTPHCEGIPHPFSSEYAKDLLLIISSFTPDDGIMPPEWFRPSAAQRRITCIQATVEDNIRAKLMPFGGRNEEYLHLAEQTSFTLASELILPRLAQLESTLAFYNIVWQWRREPSIPLPATELFAGNSAIAEPSKGGALGILVEAFHHLAEAFASFACVRGRLAAAHYTHVAAHLCLQAGNTWEAGNAFAMVANCIVGKGKSSIPEYRSFASMFLRQATNAFAAINAHAEKRRIQSILEGISPQNSETAVDQPESLPENGCCSYYFLVGTHDPSTILAPDSYGMRLEKLNVIRIVTTNTSGEADGFALSENLLIEKIQKNASRRFIDGSLALQVQSEWTVSPISTLRSLEQRIGWHFEPHASPALPSGMSYANNSAFWVRRVWPVCLPNAKASTKNATRCPQDFVLFPTSLDRSQYTIDWALNDPQERGNMQMGGIINLDRIVFSASSRQLGLTPIVARASVQPVLLDPDTPSLKALLETSMFGMPVDQQGGHLGPVPPPPPQNVSDAGSELSFDPHPPTYPPPPLPEAPIPAPPSIGRPSWSTLPDGQAPSGFPSKFPVEQASVEEEEEKDSKPHIASVNVSNPTCDMVDSKQHVASAEASNPTCDAVHVQNPIQVGNANQAVRPSFTAPPENVYNSVAGIRLNEADEYLVQDILSKQEAWFAGTVVDQTGLRQVTVHLIGQRGKGRYKRKVSTYSTMVSNSHHRGSPVLDIERSFCFELWMGDALQSGLPRTRRKSLVILDQYPLDMLAITETSVPGVLQIIEEGVEQPKQPRPLLFHTERPCALLATFYSMKELFLSI
mmetsp:Transcript_33151/g.53244  ORF Transcript_33151/g.53244 Transcript_33151/m.53244 type:complete len:1493 (-) Transcript_33151:773-5251(-)